MKQINSQFALLLITIFFIGSSANAQTVTWNGSNSSNYSVGINWTPAGVPVAGNDVIIPSGTPNSPKLSANSTVNSIVINSGASFDLNGMNFVSTTITTINGTLLSSIAGTPTLTTGEMIIGGTLDATNISAIVVGGNWTKTGSFTLGIATTVTFNGTGAQTINSATSFTNLTVNKGAGTLYLGANNIVVGGDVTLTAGSFDAGTANITLAGSSNTPFSGGGTFVANQSTVSFQGSNSSQNLGNFTYYNLDFNRNGVTFNAPAGNSGVNGNLSITAGTFYLVNNSNINLKGNFTSSGILSSTGASTITCLGTGAQSIAGVTYNGLMISNNSSSGVSLSGTASVTNLTIAGTFSDAGNQLTGSTAGTIIITSGTLKLGGATATTFPYSSVTSFTSGTVEYVSTVAQTISSSPTYNNLVLSGAGTKTAAGNFTTTNFTNTSTLSDGGYTITVNGWWVGASGTYLSGSGAVNFAGGSAHSVDGSSFNNLTITSTSLTPSAGITVNKNFITGAGGTFVAGAYTHTINGNWNDVGAFTKGTSTISFNGTSTVTTANPFNNFSVTASGNVTAANGLTFNDFSNSGTFLAGNFVHTVNGNWSNSGTFTKGTSTVVLAGTGSVDGTSFNNLTITGTITPTTNLVSTGVVTVSGILALGNFAATGSGTFVLAANGTISTTDVNGFNSAPSTTGAIQMTGGRTYAAGANYIYNGTSAQETGSALSANTIAGLTVNNSAGLTLNSTGTTTINGTLTLTNGLFSKSTGSLAFVAGGVATITRSVGTLSFAPTGTTSLNVVYTGSTGVTTANELPVATGTVLLNNLTINNSGGVTFAAGAVVTVQGVFTLTSGILNANGGLTLAPGASVNGGSSSSYVNGKMGVQVNDGLTHILTFPIGTGSDYRPVKLGLQQTDPILATYTAQMFNAAPATKTLPVTLGKVSENRYYTITGSNAVGFFGTPSITIQYGVNDGVSSASALRLANDGNGGSTWVDLGGTGSAQPTGFISRPATTVGTFVLATNFGTDNALAVELVSFTGTSKENTVSLTWTTATEHNNYGFDVERQVSSRQSAVGNNNWEKVGFVKGSGTSNSPKTYSFTDKVSGAASFDYRIKQTDVDGLSRYIGSVITVTAPIPTEFALSQNYPNPFNPSTIIKYAIPQATFVTLKIYNMLGQEVATLVNGQTDIGFHSITWNGRTNAGSFASSGVYIYRIVAGDFVQVKKMSFLK